MSVAPQEAQAMRMAWWWVGLCAWLLVAAPAAAQESASVTGSVRDQDGGAPLAGAAVLVAESSRETRTDADGRFSLRDLPPGTYTVTALRDGYAALSQPVTVARGQAITLEFALPRQISVTQAVTVLGRTSDYVEATAGASRTSARLLDVPQAIAVLPARLLEDLGALDTKDLYRHMSGVTDSPYSSTVVRGFTQREVLVNGLRGNPYGSLDGDVNNGGFSTSQFRLTNVERVEVLKGPSSTLYGSGEPGGIINYVTKKPREQFEARASLGTGSFGQALGEAEATGSLNAARTLLGRAAVYFEDRDTFRTNAATRNTHAVGGVTWKAAPRTTLALEYEYIDQRNAGHRLRGVPVDAAGDWLASYEWTVTEPNDFTDLEANVAQVRLDQAFGRGLRLDSTLRYAGYDRRENYHEPRGLQANNTIMQREFRDQLRTNDDVSWNVGLALPFNLGAGGRHDLSVGGDLLRQDFLFRAATARQASAGGPVPPIAVQHPVYGLVDPAAYGLTDASYGTDDIVSLRRGVFAQDLVTLTPQWSVLVGGRADWYDDDGTSATLPLAISQSAVTGRVGVVFKPVPAVSLYGNAANGFTRAPALAQTPSANGPHEAETAQQVEVGAKSEWFDGRLQLTGAWFQAVKQNVLRPDPDFGPTGTNVNAVLATGEVRNRGLEVDLAGAIARGWNVAANYTYLDSQITADANAALIGQPLPNAAPHRVGLFTRVDLPLGAAAAGSLEYVAERVEPFAGIRAPAYTVVDLHYFQRLTDRLRLQVRCENVFDAQYAASSLFAARAGNIPGQPRTFSVLMIVNTRAAGSGARP
jgi:iron complex outermembrane receptor protein